MYACLCTAVTKTAVVDAIDAGAASIDEIGEVTEAGTVCGGCHDTLDELLVDCGACPLAALVA
jgi:bacterioferritin-associated ferredoxin